VFEPFSASKRGEITVRKKKMSDNSAPIQGNEEEFRQI
jgi:hypothetical protein